MSRRGRGWGAPPFLSAADALERRSNRALAFAPALALALTACHWSPTQLVVSVGVAGDVTQGPAGELTDLELRVTVPGAGADASIATRRIALADRADGGGPDAGVHLPAQLFAVLPRDGDVPRGVHVEATGFRGAVATMSASAEGGFVPGSTTYVTLTLSPACLGAPCPAGQTCDATGCHAVMNDAGISSADASDVPGEPFCGDGVCNAGETICDCRDCGDPATDHACDCGETPDTSLDCPVVCGDGQCSTLRGEDPCCADCGDHLANGHCDASCESTANDPAECGTNPIDGVCNGGETCATAPHDCDPGPCTCVVYCCDVPTPERSYQADRCACRDRYLYCTGMTGSPRTYEIFYGPTMIYQRTPSSTGSYCGTGSSAPPYSC